MTSENKRKFFSSIILSVTGISIFLLLREGLTLWVLYIQNNIEHKNLNATYIMYIFAFLTGIFFGCLTEKTGTRKALLAGFGFILFWSVVNFISLLYFSANLFLFAMSCSVLIPTALIHLKKLWEIDIKLTEKLVSVISSGNIQEGKPADVRIESGLKLLETVLPLSEAIVFRIDETNSLAPVGRARNEKKDYQTAQNQESWREIIGLCEKCLKTGRTEILQNNREKGSAQAVLPLTTDGKDVGVLYVKIAQDFEADDRNLLEAFSGQLARNFERKELRNKTLPNKFWWSFLSSKSAQNRVDVIKLINNNFKEQSFSVMASSYLKEAHAIAYLDGNLAYLNRQMRHIAKIQSDKLFDLDLFSLLEHFKTEIFNEPSLALRRVLQTGEPYISELFFKETGKTLKIQISLVKVPTGEQSIHDTNVPMKPACILVTIRNITAVKENERLRSDMASLMSHELRTPITSIQGFAELLLTDETISGENREFLKIISDESQRLSKMLTTFLSVSKLEQSDKQEFQKTPVKLDKIVSEVVEDMKDTAKRKRIRLVENANSHLPPIAADRGLISRAVSNLIENAIKYSPERTSVMISTILETEFLRVVVEDRGYGIPKNEQEKVWQKFYRVAREGQDKEEESTGLGLSLVKEIVEQHGGEVEVESEVGFGSKFSVKLPRL